MLIVFFFSLLFGKDKDSKPLNDPGHTTGLGLGQDQTRVQEEEDGHLNEGASGTSQPAKVQGQARVHFIDVGQGDSILIDVDGHYALIDAGERDQGKKVVSYLRKQGVQDLEYVIASHPHSDHIGGMVDVIHAFKIHHIILPNVIHTTRTFEDFIDAIQEYNIDAIKAKPGASYQLGAAQLDIKGPKWVDSENLNNSSVVAKLTYGETAFLFPGDAEVEEETSLLGNDLAADVLKVGHHGSTSSTSPDFFSQVNPKACVISCGKDNPYGHPHAEILQFLREAGVDIYRTDQEGTIVAGSDGKEVHFNKKAGK